MDKTELDVTYVNFSIRVPKEIHDKIKYICKRSFLSRKQVLLTAAAPNIESWCKELMDEEVSLRLSKGAPAPFNPKKVYVSKNLNKIDTFE